ncbi:hypothetical protein JVT61DRAFT_11818 [Boletus reticuloceps]|uniref:Uncharacterized protein n=1 Tax=Boletus reticuloceps TaxID=495285 RepID=A0A8I3AED9_9AGAM|nr:hypothetical protein JVT61DRAFT_11818 [Boletus reticuloceps]
MCSDPFPSLPPAPRMTATILLASCTASTVPLPPPPPPHTAPAIPSAPHTAAAILSEPNDSATGPWNFTVSSCLWSVLQAAQPRVLLHKARMMPRLTLQQPQS